MRSLMSRALLTTAVIAVCGAPLSAQNLPRAISFRWTALDLVVAPDSGRIYLFASAMQTDSTMKSHWSVFKPSDALAWVSDARWFLDQKLSDADTGSIRASEPLTGQEGGNVYFVRRRASQGWAKEPLIVFESRQRGRPPILVTASDRTSREILDSVEVVGRRTPLDLPGFADSTNLLTYDSPAYPKPGQPPPEFPRGAALNDSDGIVIARFVVGADGRVDMKTARIIAAPGEPFQRSVLATLRDLKFEPARLQGSYVRSLVVMPFTFHLIRR